jgi:tetratricopeptide (TPR) repeat protein
LAHPAYSLDVERVNPIQFVESMQPHLQYRDLHGLVGHLKANWSKDQLMSLLFCDHADARKVAALSLALVGCKSCITKLADQLKDADPMVNQMAEHALWSIWFRAGSCPANHEVCQGTKALNDREMERAIEHFSRAIELDPNFAEAYNQRAIASYLLEQYERSIEDCREAVRLMPCHFGAWSGMGHCHAHLGQPADAIRCYQKALKINPHLTSLNETIEQLKPRP